MADVSGLPFLEDHARGLVLTLFIQPKSSRNTIAGIHGQALKIKLTAPPVDGAANKMCIEFMAKTLEVSKTSMEILAGHTGRNKRLLIRTEEPQTRTRIIRRLHKYTEEAKSP
jgi:hypothetical protein